MVRTVSVLALFLAAPLLVTGRVQAQDVTLPEHGDEPGEESFWDTNADGFWDAAWDDSWTEAEEDPGPFALHLTAGRRTDLVTAIAAEEDQLPAPRRMSEVYALATLQVPLDSLFFASSPRSRRTVRSLSQASPEDASTEGEGDPIPAPQREASDDDQKDVVVAPSPASPTSAHAVQALTPTRTEADSMAPSSPSPSREEKDASGGLLRLIREVARRVARAESKGDRRLNSLVRRSRLSGLVPEVRFRGVYGLDQQTSTEDAVGIYPGETTTRGGRDSLVEARLTFRLDRLVLGAGEDSLERQRSQRARESREAVAVAVETLMKWRVAMSQSEDPALLPEEQLSAQVNAERALAELYLLTDGWFVGQETLDELGVQLPPLVTAEAP